MSSLSLAGGYRNLEILIMMYLMNTQQNASLQVVKFKIFLVWEGRINQSK